MLTYRKSWFVLFALLFCLGACGGSGGGDGGTFVGAAKATLTTSPNTIDTGDRTEVRVEISAVNESGISLKLRFPSALAYVPSSATLLVDGDENDASPTVNAAQDDDNYLVFYFSQDDFGPETAGELVILLEGLSNITQGRIEVDADVDDPAVDNQSEFVLEEPEFVAESEASIVVEG